MYDKLIADLKEDAEWAAGNEWETPIMLSDHLKQAVEAIETLSMKLVGDEAAIAGMKREIERMVVAGNPHWTPVTERMPDRFTNVLTYYSYNGYDGYGVGMQYHDEHCGTIWRGSTFIPTYWMPLPAPPTEDENNV